MDILNVTRDYAQCISSNAITEPTGGTWISAAALYLGATEPVNGSWLQALCLALGITTPIHGSWVIALADYYGITQPLNGSWWYAIADEACNGGIKPIADFTSNFTTVTEGSTVNFTDLSTVPPLGPPITSWAWTFAGGTPSSSTLQNPSVVYNTAGTYTVSLTVTNADGNNTKTVTNYMTVNVVPIKADFTADTTTPVTGGTVNFTDTSTGTPTTWAWTFAGGTPASSTLQNPSVVYNTAGTYDVSLTASKPGSTDNETKLNYIVVSTPTPPPSSIDSFNVGFNLNNLFDDKDAGFNGADLFANVV